MKNKFDFIYNLARHYQQHHILISQPMKQSTKWFPTSQIPQNFAVICSFKPRVRAILHCQQHTAISLCHNQLETGFQIIDVDEKLLSHCKKTDTIVRTNVGKVHLNLYLGKQFISITFGNYPDLETSRSVRKMGMKITSHN